MRLLDWLKGCKPPPPGTPIRSATDLGSALLAINRDTAPFHVRPGGDGEPHFIAEWRIAEARWHVIFANSGVDKASRILLRINGEGKEVRAANECWSVEWHDGLPVLRPGSYNFPNRRISVQFGTAYAFTEHLSYGQDRHYRFNTWELKAPLQAVVAACGWRWQAVAVGAV